MYDSYPYSQSSILLKKKLIRVLMTKLSELTIFSFLMFLCVSDEENNIDYGSGLIIIRVKIE